MRWSKRENGQHGRCLAHEGDAGVWGNQLQALLPEGPAACLDGDQSDMCNNHQEAVQLSIASEAAALLLQVALKAVSNLLLRANSELRHLYDLYSSRQLPGVATSAAQLRHSRALTTGQFWALMRDARVLDVDCSLTDISRAVAEVSLGRWLWSSHTYSFRPHG